jgi:deltex-like protein
MSFTAAATSQHHAPAPPDCHHDSASRDPLGNSIKVAAAAMDNSTIALHEQHLVQGVPSPPPSLPGNGEKQSRQSEWYTPLKLSASSGGEAPALSDSAVKILLNAFPVGSPLFATAASPKPIIEIQDDDEDDGNQKLPAKRKPPNTEGDAALARRLQQKEDKKRKKLEQNGMQETTAGRAFLLVERILELHKQILQDPKVTKLIAEGKVEQGAVHTIGRDDMVFLAEKLMECQEEYSKSNKPTHVSLTYHFTNEKNLQSIRQDGLLSYAERRANNIQTQRRAFFGDGIYTATNPFAFRHFGDVGILTAVLKGQEERVGSSGGGSQDPNVNTVIGNKIKEAESSYADEIVLKESRQVLPILRFCSKLVDPGKTGSLRHHGNRLLWRFHTDVQKLLDEFFNSNVTTVVERVVPDHKKRKDKRKASSAPTKDIPPGNLVTGQLRPAPTTTTTATNAVASTAGTTPLQNFPTTTAPSLAALLAVQPGTGAALPAIGALSTSTATSTAAVSTTGRTPTHNAPTTYSEKQRFLMVLRIIMRYLQRSNPALYQVVKAQVEDCAQRNKRQEPGYENIAIRLRAQLKGVIPDADWNAAEGFLETFVAQRSQQQLSNAGQQQPPAQQHPAQQPPMQPPVQAGDATRAAAEPQYCVQLSQQKLPPAQTQRSQVPVAATKARLQALQHQVQLQAAIQAAQLQLPAQTLATTQPGHQAQLPVHVQPSVPPPTPAGVTRPAAAKPQSHVQPTQQQQLPSSAQVQQNQAPVATQTGFQPQLQQVQHLSQAKQPGAFCHKITYTAPNNLTDGTHEHMVRVRTLSCSEECAICFKKLHSIGLVVLLRGCSHKFHKTCLEASLNYDPRCPQCRKPITEPRGKSPSGTMIISTQKQPCGGYEDCGSISVQYSLPSGTQRSYHENPGQKYSGTNRTSFLPNNSEGRSLLARLMYAWDHGLLFSVGTSMTSGKSNRIVWSSVHQKTSLRGGMHGFPDPNFFSNCNGELDALHVPPASELIFGNWHR